MDIGDQVYIAEALHEERPVVTVVGAVLKPGACATITDVGFFSCAVQHDDGTHGVYFLQELSLTPPPNDAPTEEKRSWLSFFELLLPVHGAAKAAAEADEAVAQWLARRNAPTQALRDNCAEHLNSEALRLLKDYRQLIADFPIPCSTNDAIQLDAAEQKLLDALAPEKKEK